MVERGEVWLVALDPTVGSEIQKMRPCVVVSPPELNEHLNTIIVAPMTTGSKPAPFRVGLTFARKRGVILLDQIRTVDKDRLIRKAGAISDQALASTLSGLQEMFVD
ncbi:type II toxin-antitoxin system PemK/MazF family toxin [Paraburkholderia sp. SARCC-3016]|uniref:type II toxin-antitoxin system PemK/MazF family toxin n=1 Tax=Paraburkholderia sp. SARCC-3016 TaxID=3058611 RepID=UPI002808C49B|nr:type II toxin-antitoxin system PemK/MazF family toxin [Paraburkholderia sp. SARCC-3016]MDQ7976662.1 type II toxin-antitoxin system PemK/MazF family toxin [Paraburkholderia sp. SARCC-3016]